MKIFVIGPEGAGKTVFVAMLSHHLAARGDELVFKPVDYDSTLYVSETLELLECRKWPRSNPPGDMKVLKWRFGTKEGNPHEISLYDYAGQDMREVLLTNDPTKLQGRPSELRLEVDDADMLIYLLDMDGLIGGGTLTQTNENAWLLHEFMVRPSWRGKRRILVITKADLYAGMIEAADGNLKRMVAEHWPKVYTPDEFLEQENQIACYALTSVGVVTTLDDNGKPVRLPKIPLESEGFEELVDGILEGIDKDWSKRAVKEAGKSLSSALSITSRFLRVCVNVCVKRWKAFLVVLVLSVIGVRHFTKEKFRFTIVTGTDEGAGTDSTVWLTLHDGRGGSREISFSGNAGLGSKDPFERGATDVFTMRMRPVQPMTELTVTIEDAGNKPAWYLRGVIIENLDTGERARFPCNSWLGEDVYNPASDPWERRLAAVL